MLLKFIATFIFIIFLTSCSEENNNIADTNKAVQISDTATPQVEKNKEESNNQNESIKNKQSISVDYDQLRKLITFGKATLFEVKQALTEEDIVGLTNTIHALYSMRWHRGVHHIYYDLWHLNKEKHPDFAWDSIEKIPAKIALASTINRVQIYDAEEYKSYIRSHMYDEHEFHRAQVVVALGLNGDPKDVEYIKEMADSDNHYVTQSAISSLAMVAHVKAKDAMVELYEKYKDTARGKLILELLKKAYKWTPEKAKV